MEPYRAIRAEAQRWLGIAVKLLSGRDLVGSKTFAIRARESDPRLEFADQILAVADTLIAGEKRINNQPDWYAILQLVGRTHDFELIASQYRRLALLLNPLQKNNLPFADLAFKLVCDAYAVLSTSWRKHLYDNEINFISINNNNNNNPVVGSSREHENRNQQQQQQQLNRHHQHQQQQQWQQPPALQPLQQPPPQPPLARPVPQQPPPSRPVPHQPLPARPVPQQLVQQRPEPPPRVVQPEPHKQKQEAAVKQNPKKVVGNSIEGKNINLYLKKGKGKILTLLEFPEYLVSKKGKGKSKKRGKRPAAGLFPAGEIISDPPIDCPMFQTENSEGVFVAEPSTTIPSSRRRGEAVPVSDEEAEHQVPTVDPTVEKDFEESEESPLRRTRREQTTPLNPTEPSNTDMAGRRSVFDFINAQLYKDKPPTPYAADASGSSAAAIPPRKKRRLARNRTPPVEVRDPAIEESISGEISAEAVGADKVPENQNPEVPAPSVKPETHDFESAEHIVNSPIHPEVNEIEEDNPSDESPPEEFVIRPRISESKRPVNIKDSALTSSRVAYALTTAMILPEDSQKLKTVPTSELAYRGFQCQVGSNIYFSELSSRYKQAKKDHKAKVAGIKKELSEAKKTANEAKAEATEANGKLFSLQAEHDTMTKSAEETKANLEGQIISLQNQMADLQNSLRLAVNSKNQAVTKAREEEEKVAELKIKDLKIRHNEDLTNAETAGYNEALNDAATEIIKIKDMIYKAGYKFGLSTAGVVDGDNLFEKLVLCPPSLFVQRPAQSEEEQEDDNAGDIGTQTGNPITEDIVEGDTQTQT